MASSVVSPFSSGLPPYPTVPSHWSNSHAVQPNSTAFRAEPPAKMTFHAGGEEISSTLIRKLWNESYVIFFKTICTYLLSMRHNLLMWMSLKTSWHSRDSFHNKQNHNWKFSILNSALTNLPQSKVKLGSEYRQGRSWANFKIK